MKKFFLITLFTLGLVTSFAQGQNDTEAIKSVVSSAYVEGIQNRGNIEDIRKGFHPSFNMLRLADNQIKPFGIEEWIAALEKAKAENSSNTPASKMTAKFIDVDVTGVAAVVKLELYKDGKQTFTDYLSLYKFSEGWRIVSKIYYRQP